MANPTPPLAARPRHSKLVRIIAIVLLTLIVLVGLTVLIIWLAVKPKRLVYSIEEASIQGFNLTNNHLKANFNFALRAYNPNTKVSIYYDKVEVEVTYDNEIVAFNTVDPFFQPRRNVTHLELKLGAQDVALFGSVAKDLKLERSAGEVELEVKLKAKIRFKVGVWKSRHRTLRVLCEPVVVNFSKSNNFQRTSCDVDL